VRSTTDLVIVYGTEQKVMKQAKKENFDREKSKKNCQTSLKRKGEFVLRME